MLIDMVKILGIEYKYNEDDEVIGTIAKFCYKNIEGNATFESEGYYMSTTTIETEIANIFNRDPAKEFDKNCLLSSIKAVLEL